MQRVREQCVNREKAETGQGGGEDTALTVQGARTGAMPRCLGERGEDVVPQREGRPRGWNSGCGGQESGLGVFGA